MTEEIQYVAVAEEREDYDALGRPGWKNLRGLRNEIDARWRDGDEDERRRLAMFTTCLDRLRSVLLQSHRMSLHQQHLIEQAAANAEQLPADAEGVWMAIGAHDATTDFESLLFHARATLDHLALLVNRAHGDNSDRFSRLLPRVEHLAERYPQAVSFRDALQETAVLLNATVDDEGKAIRSVVAHRQTISAITDVVFSLHVLNPREILLFDCEAMGHGVLSTTHRVTQELPFLVSQTLAGYLPDDRSRQPLKKFKPAWDCAAVRFTDWVDDREDGPTHGVVSGRNPDGFTINWQRLKPEVFERAVRVR